MAGSVLTEQYVDIVTRNLRETMDALRAIQKQADATGEALKRMNGQGQGGSGRGVGGVVSPKGAAPGGVGAMIGAAAGPIGIATAAVAGITLKGLQGTAELEQFGMALTNIAREIGNLVAPALRVVTEMLNRLTQMFRGTGAAGQQLLLMLWPMGVVFELLGKSSVQVALTTMVRSFGNMVTALQPLLNMLGNFNDMFLDAFVVQPLVWFIDQLTTAVMVMTELAKRTMVFVQAFASFAGLGKLFDTPKRARFESTLNQTGTEDASGTFQRIQQAIFKASTGAEGMDVQDKQLAKLEEIAIKAQGIVTGITAIHTAVSGYIEQIKGGLSTPAAIAQGGINAAATGTSGAIGIFKAALGIR